MFNKDMFPIIWPIEGTGYEGRNDRIEFVKEGDPLILKADYHNKFYSPVAIEVFNTKGESLGYLCDYGMYAADESTTVWLENLAMYVDCFDVTVDAVTPLSQRSSRAKYALMNVCLNVKEDACEKLENVEYKYSLTISYDKGWSTVNKAFKNKFNSFSEAEDYAFEYADEHDLDGFGYDIKGPNEIIKDAK